MYEDGDLESFASDRACLELSKSWRWSIGMGMLWSLLTKMFTTTEIKNVFPFPKKETLAGKMKSIVNCLIVIGVKGSTYTVCHIVLN